MDAWYTMRDDQSKAVSMKSYIGRPVKYVVTHVAEGARFQLRHRTDFMCETLKKKIATSADK